MSFSFAMSIAIDPGIPMNMGDLHYSKHQDVLGAGTRVFLFSLGRICWVCWTFWRPFRMFAGLCQGWFAVRFATKLATIFRGLATEARDD